ncbi:MATE family efflux transporter [Clostridium sporogenes]|uniref:MATE family efflux transporter n=1 Tax=Clostridium sporogenes TaxID=1509 RepID=UPI00024BAC4F|nr:MATE family efflux transporter [Clostridium sporogenes]EHN15760.1 MATE efflux family protein [Clostridium sporogenes PA 3679]MCW6107530.1 MATE family efflux transporter [Clostridium sporogenes]MDU4599531.1 MATE family efflux transporter [Clostridium sporogenes]NFQ35848.1 MATE family efflux transporter [Clostridium sporogenes]NFQ61691.1 MATE family efflux transporter [Clostridium sporogenes]
MNKNKEELLHKEPKELMLKLCIPAIIGMVVIGLYSFMDGVFAGQLIGKNAMGAVAVAYPITFLNSAIATLIGIGSSSILSRAIGKNDQETVNKIMGNLLCLVLIFSTIVMVVGIVFAKELLLLTGAEGQILELAVRYLRIIFIGSIFVNFAQSANMVMRGEGIMKKAMLFMTIGAVLNIILDPILIIAFGKYGIEGAATATIISQVIQAVITMVYFIRKSKNVRFHKIQIEKTLLPEIFSVGLSAMMMQLMSMIQQTLMYRMAAKYGGNNQLILMGATLRIQALSFIPLWGMSQGLQPVVGTNYRAKLFSRVKKCMNIFILGATILACVFWIPIELFPQKVLSLMITDVDIVNEGITNFRIMYSLFPALGTFIMGVTFFQSIGSAKNAGLLVLLRQVILFVPAIIIFPYIVGISAVWFVSPLIDGIVFIMLVYLILKEYKKMDTVNLSEAI